MFYSSLKFQTKFILRASQCGRSTAYQFIERFDDRHHGNLVSLSIPSFYLIKCSTIIRQVTRKTVDKSIGKIYVLKLPLFLKKPFFSMDRLGRILNIEIYKDTLLTKETCLVAAKRANTHELIRQLSEL